MTLNELNDAVASVGGRWVKLRTTDDPAIEGEILDFTRRDRTDPEGNVVYKRGTSSPRIEWLFTLATDLREDDDDDGNRKLPCNESMQRAISIAIKAAGKAAEVGGRLKVGVKANPEDSYKQAEYIARYTPPVAVAVADDDLIGF